MLSFVPRCSHQMPWLQSSLPLGPRCRSRQTPVNVKDVCCFKASLSCLSRGLKQLKLQLPYLLPGVQDHDVIGGEVVLCHLPGYLLNLTGTEGLSDCHTFCPLIFKGSVHSNVLIAVGQLSVIIHNS